MLLLVCRLHQAGACTMIGLAGCSLLNRLRPLWSSCTVTMWCTATSHLTICWSPTSGRPRSDSPCCQHVTCCAMTSWVVQHPDNMQCSWFTAVNVWASFCVHFNLASRLPPSHLCIHYLSVVVCLEATQFEVLSLL